MDYEREVRIGGLGRGLRGAAIGVLGSGWRGQDKGSRERAEARRTIEERLAELDGAIAGHRERMKALDADIESSVREL